MENSIEEDIKILEKKIEDYKPYKNIEYCSHAGQILQEEYKALEHILSDYKRALKENEKLKNKLLDTLEGQKVIEEETPQYIKENYISKEKVKEKIEELNKLLEEDLQDERKINSNRFIIICQCKNCLQELLEGRK